MWRCSWLLIAGLAAILPAHADAAPACVSSEKSNTISVIDTDKLQVVETIKVGQRPRGFLVTRDKKHILVCTGDDDAIQMIDTNTDKIVGTPSSGADPEELVDHPNGGLLYVANEDSNMDTVIDIATLKVVKTIPVGERAWGVFIAAP